ncbi:ABC transporter permease [Bacteroidia bacterium]|nr:ABC transporter permease [Bacteroidia bacterium]
MLKHYLTLVFRGLKKYKLLNIICILGLTIGFSAFVFGTYWWYWENHYDNFHPDADRTYAVTLRGLSKASDGSDLELNQVHKDDIVAFLQDLPEIETYSLVNNWERIEYKDADLPQKIMGIDVDSAFFNMFYAEFIDGSFKNRPFDGTCIVLTEKTALEIFGKTNCAGELFTTTSGSLTIAGVIRDYPSNTNFRVEFLKLTHFPLNSGGRISFYVKLHHQADVNAVRKKIEEHRSVAQIPDWQGDTSGWSFRLRSLPEVHLTCSPELKGRFLNIRLLGFAGLLALLCALMNALVLFIGQQQRKQSKNKTFRSMGASNHYLFRKSFIDLSVPIVIALALTAFVISLLFPYYQSYTQWQGYGIYENYFNRIDMNALSTYSFKWTGVILAVFLLLSSLLIIKMLRKTGVRSFALLRNMLIVSQIFIGCFFFFISLSLYKQVAFTQNKDKGIVVNNITQIDVGYYTKIDFKLMGEELLRSPYIDDVTFTTQSVLTGDGNIYETYIGKFCFQDNPDDVIDEIHVHLVEPNFFDFFGIRFKEGATMTEENDIVINATQQQALPDKHPVGKTVKAGVLADAKICGVIQDYYYSTMQYPIRGLFFHQPKAGMVITPYQYAYIKTKPENHEKAIEYVKTLPETLETGDVAPGKQILELQDIQTQFNRPETILFRIFGFLSLICVLVASFGIYSLVMLTIEQRKKEIAIRKINGAEVRDILVLFLRNYLLLVIAGNALSLPVAYFFINSWLENYIYRTPLSWWLFVVVFIVTGLTVLLSVVEKVRMAAKENPAEKIND